VAFGIVHHFPGGTKEQYEAVLLAVHTNDVLPEGQVLHCAGPVDDGWRIFAIHDSRASWEKFRDGVLLPSMQAGVEGGFVNPPVETEIELDTVRCTPQLMDIAR
jgi:hypothetical protein